MRRTFKSAPLVEAISQRIVPSSQICHSCHRQIPQLPFLPFQSTRSKSSNLPFTERLRRKIWGTDNPPGLADPYGGPSFLERRRMDPKQLEELEERERREAFPKSQLAEPSPESHQSIDSESPHWRTVAVEPAKVDPNYVPAETWDGLERVGFSGHWRDLPSTAEEDFVSYLGYYEKATTQEEFLCSLHQATVEVFTLKDSMPALLGELRDVTYPSAAIDAISNTTITFDQTSRDCVLGYQDDGKEIITEALSQQLQEAEVTESDLQTSSPNELANADTEEGLQEPSPASEDTTRPSIDNEQEAEEESLDEIEQRLIYPVESLKFLSFPLLDNLELRFQVIKRVSQLTGHRIADPVINSARTLMPIYEHLLTQDSRKPKKATDRILANENLINLPNVHFMSRRETPVDRDKRFGRWKVIEAELESKGLPVLSSRSG